MRVIGSRVRVILGTVLLAAVAAGGVDGDAATGEKQDPPPLFIPGPKKVDAALGRRIDAAIESGTRALAARQHDDGSFGSAEAQSLANGSYGFGLTALCGLALRHGGLAADDPHVVAARTRVRRLLDRHVPEDLGKWCYVDVYTAGLSIAFLLASGSDAKDDVVVRAVRRLEATYGNRGFWSYAMEARIDPATLGASGRAAYPTAVRTDFGNISTTLYAVYGLVAAKRSGIAVDPRGPVRLSTSLASLLDTGDAFNYMPAARTIDAAHHTYFGGIASAVAIRLMCEEVSGRWERPWHAKGDPLVERGVRSIAEEFDRRGRAPWSRDRDPLFRDDAYNLYAVERIGMLLDTDVLAGFRWYEAGAERLTTTQRRDGTWPAGPGMWGLFPDATTSFSILFLARAGRPVGTVTTGSGSAAATGAASAVDEEIVSRGADAFARLDWVDTYHRAMARISTVGGERRARMLPQVARLGPGSVRMLIRDLEADDVARRIAAAETLRAVVGEDFGPVDGADPAPRAAVVAAWRRWLDFAEPMLVLDGDVLIVRAPATGALAPRRK